MSVFTSRVTRTIEIPHDPGQSVTIRKLAPRHLEQAAKAHQFKSMDDLRKMGGPAFIKELQSLTDAQRAAVVDPLNAFDHVVLMEKAVTGWTYEMERTAENFADLDEQTATLLAREILLLSKPSLFETKEDGEAAQKNG